MKLVIICDTEKDKEDLNRAIDLQKAAENNSDVIMLINGNHEFLKVIKYGPQVLNGRGMRIEFELLAYNP